MTEHKLLRRTVFAAYCLLMVYLLFLQRGRSPIFGGGYVDTMLANLNLRPGAEICRFLRVWSDPMYHRAAVVNLIGNVVMFIPLGFGLPWANAPLRRFWKTLLVSAGIIILVEITQLITLLGHCDVDDLILNLIGVSIGYTLYALFYKLGIRNEE
ncbi:MAG: VanZ family protein [Oscillospiraceae bacterium]|nr:VanZ family protein [Oscillospiraceae bacterium]